jgi:hypothetical protein
MVAWSGHGADSYIDALQLSIATRTIAHAPNSLTSVQLFTRGHAFWGVQYLHRLLNRNTHLLKQLECDSSSVDEVLQSWLLEFGEPFEAMNYFETLTRSIVEVVEHGFSRLIKLAYRVDTTWSDDTDEQQTIALALSRGLKQALKLERLDLCFRNYAVDEDCGTYAFFDHSLSTRYPSQDEITKVKEVSTNLLIRPALILHNLRHLHLSLSTSAPHLIAFFGNLKALRYLKLTYVALFPDETEQQWETVLA